MKASSIVATPVLVTTLLACGSGGGPSGPQVDQGSVDISDTGPKLEDDSISIHRNDIGEEADTGFDAEDRFTPPSTCGNGMREPGEPCDPSLTPSLSCADISDFYESGTAFCTSDCRLELADCNRLEAICGNGVVEPGEACEPTVSSIVGCETLAPMYSGGTAVCLSDCSFDFSGCEIAPYECGNGVVEGGEECDDGPTFASGTCSSDCRLLQDGQPLVFEPAEGGGDFSNAIMSMSYVCSDPIIRSGWHQNTPAVVKYDLIICSLEKGTPAKDVNTIRASMASITNLFASAGILLKENSVQTFQYGNCSVVYEKSADLRKAVEPYLNKGIVPLVFVSIIKSYKTFSSLGGFCEFGGLCVVAQTSPYVIGHELGHFFGLAHTFDCTNGIETAQNCNLAGDLLCDTPPDHGPANFPYPLDICADGSQLFGTCNCNGKCGSHGSCTTGESPECSNLMSYYLCWPATLSVGQMDFMRCTLEHELLAYRSNCIPAAEICNGIDDDCDGETDEGLVQSCVGQGQCAGHKTCVDGKWGPCTIIPLQSVQEVCNGKDDDCDGETDEDVNPLSEPSAKCKHKGICAAIENIQICKDGTWTCVYPDGYVEEECKPMVDKPGCLIGSPYDPTCTNGLDDDCDGVVDENTPKFECEAVEKKFFEQTGKRFGDPCWASPYGLCAKFGGVYKCGQMAGECGVDVTCQGALFPDANEQCDGLDHDCDGFINDRNDIDGDGYGDCPGAMDCDETNKAIHPGATEDVCNGKDDDCDGQTDEGQECKPGSKKNQGCGFCGTQELVCGNDCKWHPNGPCVGGEDQCPGEGWYDCGGDCSTECQQRRWKRPCNACHKWVGECQCVFQKNESYGKPCHNLTVGNKCYVLKCDGNGNCGIDGGWKHFGSGTNNTDNCYKLIQQPLAYDAARAVCQSKGNGDGDLVCVNHKEENDFLMSQWGSNYGWIGLTDDCGGFEENKFRCSRNCSKPSASFANSMFDKAKGEPNDAGRSCAIINPPGVSSKGLWFDKPCNENLWFFCEVYGTPISE